VTLFTEELDWLSDDDKTWIMGRGLCEWIGWQLPSSKLRVPSSKFQGSSSGSGSKTLLA